MEGHDRLLPLAPAAARDAAALRLGLHPRRAHAVHADTEDVLDGLAHLSLVRPLVDAERVLVGGEERVALLGDDRPDDHLARVHSDAAFSVFWAAFSVSRASAASDTTIRACPITSATPTASACMTVTSRRLRNDFTAVSSPSVSTTSTLPSPSKPAIASAADFVDGASNLAGSSAAIEPRSACTDRAARSARLRALRFTLTV